MSETFTKQNDLNTFYNFIKGSSYLNNNSNPHVNRDG